MAHSNTSVAAEAGAILVSADPHHGHDHPHSHTHTGHSHADHDHAAHAPASREIAMPRSYKRSMFLASALERLVIAALLSGLIWLGISWAVS
jgi:ABC-type Zn2+ transport system substrate-binding protein/surface adhesin